MTSRWSKTRLSLTALSYETSSNRNLPADRIQRSGFRHGRDLVGIHSGSRRGGASCLVGDSDLAESRARHALEPCLLAPFGFPRNRDIAAGVRSNGVSISHSCCTIEDIRLFAAVFPNRTGISQSASSAILGMVSNVFGVWCRCVWHCAKFYVPLCPVLVSPVDEWRQSLWSIRKSQ